MALIWLLKSGEEQHGPPFDARSLEFCFNELGLRQRDRIETCLPLIIGERRSPELDLRYTVIELTEEDLSEDHPGWQMGCYLLKKDATEVIEILKQFPVANNG